MQQTSPKAMLLNPSEAGWDHGLDIMGFLRQSSHLLPGIDCEQSLFCSKFCQCPRYNSSLRKHPFLVALRRWGRFTRRNVCDSAAEIPC